MKSYAFFLSSLFCLTLFLVFIHVYCYIECHWLIYPNLSFLFLMGIFVFSSLGLLRTILLRTFCTCAWYTHLWGIYLHIKLQALGYTYLQIFSALPGYLPELLYQFILLPIVYNSSGWYCLPLRVFSSWLYSSISLQFKFALLWLSVRLSIFSCDYWTFGFPFLWNICLCLLFRFPLSWAFLLFVGNL